MLLHWDCGWKRVNLLHTYCGSCWLSFDTELLIVRLFSVKVVGLCQQCSFDKLYGSGLRGGG